MKNDPREMIAKFDSVCAESSKKIKRGDRIIYWPTMRSAYLIGHAPLAEAEFTAFLSLAYEEDHGHCIY
jgi:hypothetical protein